MNILLGVYACEPNKGSEPEVGWQMVNEIAKAMPKDNIYAITKANNRSVIEKENYPPNLTFLYYAPPKLLTFWKSGGRGIRTYYYLWMLGAAFYAKKQNIAFDIIHHVTFVNDWLPSFFSILKNSNNKFVWGPIGSHDPIANKFLDGNKRQLIERFRIFLQCFFRKLDPSFYYCKKKADLIIGINENVANKLALDNSQSFLAVPAIGINENNLLETKKTVNNVEPFKVISVGRFIYIKNFKLTLYAFAEFIKNVPIDSNVRLEIIGDGNDRDYLKRLATELGIINKVDFLGKIPMAMVQTKLSEADVFLFPTLENAGFVILEAMSHSLPILAMDYGGPQQFVNTNIDSQLVSENDSYDTIVKTLSDKLLQLFSSTDIRLKIGNENRLNVLNNYTWEAKAQRMTNIYSDTLNET